MYVILKKLKILAQSVVKMESLQSWSSMQAIKAGFATALSPSFPGCH